ncbi:MAG: hypothetical protein FJZ15_07460 [Candidatus Omnitrophica bacterium]|nr:hypothetical protein [Candidatus Omnitrophota bacterium]
MKILTRNGFIDAVALFFEVTDEQLERIKNNKDYYLSRELLEEFNKSKGDNVHFFGASNSGEPLKIQDYFKELLKDYKSVSWWDKDMDTFQIIRR